MLNGRNHTGNNFTCIRPQGTSVVDDCIIPHEDLDNYVDFNIQTVSELINELGIVDSTALATKPDHSVLSWKMKASAPSLPSSHMAINDLKSSFTLGLKKYPCFR